MESFDLNINNYDLNDLLNLFNIPFDFDNSHLKTCKRRVHMSHPDKSGLDKDYYLFFTKAYNILVNIYNFKHKKHTDTNYTVEQVEHEMYDAIKKFTNSDNFLKEFNKLFEENKLSNEFMENGYGDWLKETSDKSILELAHLSKQDQLKKIQDLKQKKHQLVNYEHIQEYEDNNGGFSNLTNNKPNNYSSHSIFSKLQFEDIKQAHETSLIHVLPSDKRKQQYNSIGELKLDRDNHINPLSKTQSIEYLNAKYQIAEQHNTTRAFELAKQSQEAEHIQQRTDGYFKRITY